MDQPSVGAALTHLLRQHLEPLEKRIAQLEEKLAEPEQKPRLLSRWGRGE